MKSPHSTPVWLIDYMLARLRPLIAAMSAAKRRVFEPAVGHGGFLVAALRVLDELMPAEVVHIETTCGNVSQAWTLMIFPRK